LAENLPDIVSRFDRQLRHIYVNRAVERLTGRRVEEFLGKRNAELGMPTEFVQLWDSQILAAFDSACHRTVEFKYESLDGSKHFESSLMPELAADGTVETVLCISRDVTDRVRAKEQEEVHLAQLAHMNRLSTVGGLVSEIAHEINQPLHAIVNYAQAGINVLQQTPVEQRENLFAWLNQISEQANRAAEIIRHAGRFARKTPFRRSTINLNELVRDCLKLIAFDFRLNHILLRCEFTDGIPPLLGDAIQIQQVIVNLARNAVEALAETSQDDRQVLIRTDFSEGEARISVQDNGCGLANESRLQLFEPFFTTKRDGLGLGLAVCQSIAAAHHGRLAAEPNHPRGTTFIFVLPVHQETHDDVGCHA
jgi:two-component system sensor kinase FixL